MASAHLSDNWHDLYVMLGTSTAALIGLLFVAISLHQRRFLRFGHLECLEINGGYTET
jgi:hypothetical protein